MEYRSEDLKEIRYVRCTIAGHDYCVSMSCVRRIRNVAELQPPTVSDQARIVGWIVAEDQYSPVISLHEELSQADDSLGHPQKVLILYLSLGYYGILVESVEEMFEAPYGSVYSLPPMLGEKIFQIFNDVVNYKDKLILSLNPISIYNKFFSVEESCIASDNLRHSSFSHVNLSIAHHRQSKLVIFSTTSDHGLLYGLSITQIPQILQYLSILEIPGSAPHIIGIIEWRGIILPVVDISLLIENKQTSISVDARIIVVRLASQPIYVAVIIHSNIMIQSFPLFCTMSIQDHALKGDGIIGQFELSDRILVIPDMDKLIMQTNDIAFV